MNPISGSIIPLRGPAPKDPTVVVQTPSVTQSDLSYIRGAYQGRTRHCAYIYKNM